jgi:hypothetical protein
MRENVSHIDKPVICPGASAIIDSITGDIRFCISVPGEGNLGCLCRDSGKQNYQAHNEEQQGKTTPREGCFGFTSSHRTLPSPDTGCIPILPLCKLLLAYVCSPKGKLRANQGEKANYLRYKRICALKGSLKWSG